MDQSNGIIVKHSADRMKAFVSLSKGFGAFNAGMILTELLHSGIVHGLNTAIIHKLVSVELFDKFVEVAQGTFPKTGADGRVEIIAGLSPDIPSSSGADDIKNSLGIIRVKTGDKLMREIPPVPGVNGMDVFGGVLPAPEVKKAPLRIGDGVEADVSDPNMFIAGRDGSFRYDAEGLIEVCPFMDIAGDVDDASGNIFFTGDLRISGTVRPDRAIDASGSIEIMGSVEDAAIKCGGDLVVRTAVLGGEKSMIECGGSLWAGKFQRAALNADGNVTVAGNIVDAEINCNGILKADGIVGGSVAAAGGVIAKTAGNASGTPTVIDIGAMYVYIKKQEGIRDRINVQNLISDGYVSELYCCVRDNMDEFGDISERVLPQVDELIKNLRTSVAVKNVLLKELAELKERLNAVAECSIAIDEVYSGTLFKLGVTEQRVTMLLKNVFLKPSTSVTDT